MGISHAGIQALLGILSGQSDFGSICRVSSSVISSTGGACDLTANLGVGKGMLGIVGANGDLLNSPMRLSMGVTGPINGQGDLQGRLNMSALMRALLDGRSSLDNDALSVARGIRSQVDAIGVLGGNLTRTYGIGSTLGALSTLGSATPTYLVGFGGSAGSTSGMSVGVLVNRGLRTQLVGLSELTALLNLVQNPLNVEIVNFILSIRTQQELDLFVKTVKEFTLER